MPEAFQQCHVMTSHVVGAEEQRKRLEERLRADLCREDLSAENRYVGFVR